DRRLPHADARHPRREGLPLPGRARTGALRHAQGQGRPGAPGSLSRGGSLDPETAGVAPLVRRGRGVARSLAALLICAAVAAPARAGVEDAMRYEEVTLKNGLRVLLMPDRRLPRVAVV